MHTLDTTLNPRAIVYSVGQLITNKANWTKSVLVYTCRLRKK